MAKESSFDVVSSVDMQEVANAHQQASRELSQRYDLKGTGSGIALDRKAGTFTVTAPSEFVCGQVVDVLGGKLAKRGVDLASLDWGPVEPAAGGTVRRSARIIQGIDQDTARRIAKDIRGLKLKCKATVEGDKLRVSSASRDTLQKVIAYLREQDYGQPLQYVNYR